MGLPRVCLLKLGHSICLIHVEVYLHGLWVLLQPAREHTDTLWDRNTAGYGYSKEKEQKLLRPD